jgi:YD repeat-containing protein
MFRIRNEQLAVLARDLMSQFLVADLTEAGAQASYQPVTGEVEVTTAPGQATRLLMDEEGRITQVTTPLGRKYKYAFKGRHLAYVVMPTGLRTTFTNDSKGRPVAVRRGADRDTYGDWREELGMTPKEEAGFERTGMPAFYLPVEITYATIRKERKGGRVVEVASQVVLGSEGQAEEARGPLAILVVAFSFAAPFVQQFMAFGVFGGDPPTCTSREVIAMVDDMIRKSPLGPSVQSISGHREISYDPASQTRKGQCLVKTQTETVPASYSVKMLNRTNGTFQVGIEPIIPVDPPPCTDPEVIALVERLLRDGPQGHLLRTVAGHEETRFDRERKTRHGRCRVTTQGWTVNVAYKVCWVDQKTGQFQVEIEP